MKDPRNNRRHRGFTLMEMLVVLAILVLLAGMVLPRVLGSSKKANIQAAKVQIRSFKGALEQYSLHTNSFPATEQGLTALVQKPAESGSEETTTTSGWDGPYLEEIPKDPWGKPYQYEYPPTRGKGEYPDIWSYGPDGQDNTEDDVVSWTSAQDGEPGSPGEEAPPSEEPPPREE
jgi:general secretion pathway protein G